MIAFGPISSRRLGKSLGINNIVSRKVCSYSCVYCQIGKTTHKSIIRESFYEPEKLVQDVEDHLKKLDRDHFPDYLTFVSNGEPTLDINLGKEIKLLKKFGIPIAVITNASLIQHPEVREDLMETDWVSLKVDTVDEKVWRKINRPMAGLDIREMLSGMQTFATWYKGKLHTETMLVEGYNDRSLQWIQCAAFIALLKPKKAYLSIPIRPPALREINPVSEEKLIGAWQVYSEAGLSTELLAGFEGTDAGTTGNAYEDVLNITAVHPLRQDSMVKLLEQNNASLSVIDSLIRQGLIKKTRYKEKTYYVRNYHDIK